jgi:hypothetical protein
MTSSSQLTNNNYSRGLILSAIIFIFFFLLLSYVVSYIDNTTMLTANGLWKVPEIQKWYQNSPDKRFMPAEILYEPTYALLSHLLPDSLLLFQKMPIVNSFFGALALSFYFFLIYILTSNIWASFFGVVFHLGMAFFLGLNITSEDIMPAYSLFMAAVVFFTLYAKQPKLLYFFLGTQLFVLSFLFHWTVLFPALPAITLAILFLDNNFSKAKRNCILFFSFFMIIPVIGASFGNRFIGLPSENLSFLNILQRIFWPGKGLGTGWGGFKEEKIIIALSGMSEYLIGGQNLNNLPSILMTDHFHRMLFCLGILFFLGIFFCVWLYKNWANPAHRTTGIILGTTFFCGLAMNLYTQPQDPQFVIQPLAWVPFSFSMLMYLGYSKIKAKKAFFLTPLIFLIALIPFYINLTYFFLPTKGATTKAMKILKSLEKDFNPDNTVFVIHGFEPFAPWAHVLWGPCLLDNVSEYRPNQCHILYLTGESIHSPSKTPLESAQATTDRISQAFQFGKKVVANSIWELSEQKFIDSFVSIATPEKARFQYEDLHKNFEGTFLVQTGWGNFYELKLKNSLP